MRTAPTVTIGTDTLGHYVTLEGPVQLSWRRRFRLLVRGVAHVRARVYLDEPATVVARASAALSATEGAR
jgi:hypothetical protein